MMIPARRERNHGDDRDHLRQRDRHSRDGDEGHAVAADKTTHQIRARSFPRRRPSADFRRQGRAVTDNFAAMPRSTSSRATCPLLHARPRFDAAVGPQKGPHEVARREMSRKARAIRLDCVQLQWDRRGVAREVAIGREGVGLANRGDKKLSHGRLLSELLQFAQRKRLSDGARLMMTISPAIPMTVLKAGLAWRS